MNNTFDLIEDVVMSMRYLQWNESDLARQELVEKLTAISELLENSDSPFEEIAYAQRLVSDIAEVLKF